MIRIDEIVALSEAAFDAEPMAVRHRHQTKEARAARLTTYYLVRHHLGLSTTDIGKEFGRDHTTIGYGCRKVAEQIKAEPAFQAIVERLHRAVEFRMVVDASNGKSCLAIAQEIQCNPRRRGMAATIYEIASMADGLVDLWNAARTAEAVLASLKFTETNNEEQDPETIKAARAYVDAFVNQMDAFRNQSREEQSQ